MVHRFTLTHKTCSGHIGPLGIFGLMWGFGPKDHFGPSPHKSRPSPIGWPKLIGLKLIHVVMYEIQNI